MNKPGVSMSLEGRVALVTGGSRGIGAATVKMLVAAGAKVAFNYQQAKSAADAIVASCGADRCLAVQCDLSSVAAAQSLVTATVKKFGRLDILVANHGIWPAEDVPIEKMSEEQWRRTLAVNLDSVFGLVKYSVAQMKSQPRQSFAAGHVVLVSSTAGQRGEAFHCDYAATKGALISMVKGLATELAPHHIYVNCVAPGWVDTDMSRPALDDAHTAREIFNKIPLGRVGTPEEIAA